MVRQLEYNATITQRTDLAPGLFIIRVVPDVELFEFAAGQYTVLGRKRKEPRCTGVDSENLKETEKDPEWMIQRAYSIGSGSVERGYLDFFIVLVDEGDLTPRLYNLKTGDRIYLGKKATGQFTLDKVPDDKHLLMIATGTGLAPYISMTRSHFQCNSGRTFVVFHGARHVEDLGYYSELSTIQRICNNFTYIPSITRPQEGIPWDGLTGRIPALVQSGKLDELVNIPITPDNFHIFLCGHPGMISDVTEFMSSRGFFVGDRKNPGNIHTEEYW